VIRAASALAEFLFPTACLSCGCILPVPSEPPFCGRCAGRIRFVVSPVCPGCGVPHAAEGAPDHLCGTCLGEGLPPARCRSMGVYEGVLLESIHAFKYGGNLALGEHLGRMMARHAYPLFSFAAFSLLVPVPLHPRRLRERGFNQCVVLARQVARGHGLPLELRALRRVVDTESLTGLTRGERRSNLRKAFACPRPASVEGRSVLLVDDVATTGSTLAECARALLAAGARSVGALTLARAVQEVP